MARNYRQEYDSYHKNKKQKKRRAHRNAARRLMIAAGASRKGDGKDVHHVDRNPRNNSKRNLRVTTRKANRGWRRGS